MKQDTGDTPKEPREAHAMADETAYPRVAVRKATRRLNTQTHTQTHTNGQKAASQGAVGSAGSRHGGILPRRGSISGLKLWRGEIVRGARIIRGACIINVQGRPLGRCEGGDGSHRRHRSRGVALRHLSTLLL